MDNNHTSSIVSDLLRSIVTILVLFITIIFCVKLYKRIIPNDPCNISARDTFNDCSKSVFNNEDCRKNYELEMQYCDPCFVPKW